MYTFIEYFSRILTQGSPVKQTSLIFRLGKSTAYSLVDEVCKGIVEVLGAEYVRTPSTPEEWLQISQEFYHIWQSPNCGGALDGKHIFGDCPENSGSQFYSYKKRFSFHLMALVDAHARFL